MLLRVSRNYFGSAKLPQLHRGMRHITPDHRGRIGSAIAVDARIVIESAPQAHGLASAAMIDDSTWRSSRTGGMPTIENQVWPLPALGGEYSAM